MAIGSLICLLYLGAIAHGGRYRNSIKHEDKNPHPKFLFSSGQGTLNISLTPLLSIWEKGPGDGGKLFDIAKFGNSLGWCVARRPTFLDRKSQF